MQTFPISKFVTHVFNVLFTIMVRTNLQFTLNQALFFLPTISFPTDSLLTGFFPNSLHLTAGPLPTAAFLFYM